MLTPSPPIDSESLIPRELEALVPELLGALERLQRSGSVADEERARACVDVLICDVVKELGSGDAAAARRALDKLSSLRDHVEDHWEPQEDPYQGMLERCLHALETLELADGALEGLRVSSRMKTSTLHKAVLRAFVAEPDQMLRRGQVVERMVGGKKLHPTRIGQLLVELHDFGLLSRVTLPARGGRTHFYRLAPDGLELCRSLFGEPRLAAGKQVANASSRGSWPWLDEGQLSSVFAFPDP